MKYLQSSLDVDQVLSKIAEKGLTPDPKTLKFALENENITKREYHWLKQRDFRFLFIGGTTIFASDGSGNWSELK